MKLSHALTLSFLLGCGPGGAGGAIRPTTSDRGGRVSSTGEGCDKTLTLSLVWMDEAKRQELERQLNEGLVFISMHTCGEPELVRDCHVTADYKLSSDEMSTTIDKVRTDDDVVPFAFAKDSLSKFPGGYVVTAQTSTLLLDGKSLGNDPTGSDCGRATHVVTAVLLGTFRIAHDEKAVRTAGDPIACKNEGVRSKDCRALVAMNLRALHEGGKGAKPASEHEETGIIAPH